MKTSLKYRILVAIIICAGLNTINQLSAQTTHNVAVSDFKFEPANLSIAPGDIVKWTNNQGSHSVDGTTATYSGNPVSFGNSAGPAGWTFSFTFDTEGTYDYECGVHGKSMVGKITVGSTTGIDDNTAEFKSIKAFPNPTNRTLNIPFSDESVVKNRILTLSIFDLSGAKLKQEFVSSDNSLQISLDELTKGIYFYKLSSANEVLTSGKFVKIE